jgi:hypothetical protein
MRFLSGQPETPEQTRYMIALVKDCWGKRLASEAARAMHYRGLETWYERPHAVFEMTRAQWQARQDA